MGRGSEEGGRVGVDVRWEERCGEGRPCVFGTIMVSVRVKLAGVCISRAPHVATHN